MKRFLVVEETGGCFGLPNQEVQLAADTEEECRRYLADRDYLGHFAIYVRLGD